VRVEAHRCAAVVRAWRLTAALLPYPIYPSSHLPQVADASATAGLLGVDPAALLQELNSYNAAAAKAAAAEPQSKQQQQQNAGGFDAFHKRYFPSQISTTAAMWVMRVTPVLHYTMGGAEINAAAAVMDRDGRPLQRVWAAGEATGGLHGRNRLGGNSLAECVVFGRIAGRNAALQLDTQQQQQERQYAAVQSVGVRQPISQM